MDNLEHLDRLKHEEGVGYIFYLAQKFNVRLNTDNPFITYKTKDECPQGRFPLRTYPNYQQSDSKITETHMAQDLIKTVFGNDNYSIIDTKGEFTRPTTISTAVDAALKIADQLKTQEKTIHILLQSNQPHVKRMELATQRTFEQVFKENGINCKVIVEGVGYQSPQNVSLIHSELATLITEAYKNYITGNTTHPKREIENLLYQSRDNNMQVEKMQDEPIDTDLTHSTYSLTLSGDEEAYLTHIHFGILF